MLIPFEILLAEHNMAVRRVLVSSSILLIFLFVPVLLVSQKSEYGVKNAVHLVITSGLDAKVYPGRNSPGWRRAHLDIRHFLKLQSA